MAERAAYLIVTVAADGTASVFSGHRTEAEAGAMLAKLSALVSTSTVINFVEVPVLDGAPAAVPSPYAAGVLTPLPAPKPAPFRRPSPDEFEAETIAMMNGEIPMDGIQWRDADAPISEGGAVS